MSFIFTLDIILQFYRRIIEPENIHNHSHPNIVRLIHRRLIIMIQRKADRR